MRKLQSPKSTSLDLLHACILHLSDIKQCQKFSFAIVLQEHNFVEQRYSVQNGAMYEFTLVGKQIFETMQNFTHTISTAHVLCDMYIRKILRNTEILSFRATAHQIINSELTLNTG